MIFRKAILLTSVILSLWLSSASAQIYTFTTIAGAAGTLGSTDGLGGSALFAFPFGMAVDGSNNLYVADYGNDNIRKIVPLPGDIWGVTTIAGTAGAPGSADGLGGSALFNGPMSVAVDASNNLYVADYGNSTIRQISPVGLTWAVTTIAGAAGVTGSVDGVASAARFNFPGGVASDSTGNVYVADSGNNTIRKIIPQDGNWVVTIAGTAGTVGSRDGTNSYARFNQPAGMAVDNIGNVYVADFGNNTIRKIAPVGTNWVVSTIAGTAGKSGKIDGTNNLALFNRPMGLAMDTGGNLYVADSGNNTIRKIVPVGTNWVVSTIAGTAGKSGTSNGTGSAARFNMPAGVATDSSGNVYVCDTQNATIRRGLAVAATFVPFQGIYNGLVIQTNAPSQASSGTLKLTLAETGVFTANLMMGGTKLTFTGGFDQSGNATNQLVGPSWVFLHLDLTNGTEEISGVVSNGGFQSIVLADLATFSKTSACPQVGVYTFAVMPPSDDDVTLPKGWGYGTVTVTSTGIGKISGALGDGTKLSATIPISKCGTAPLYSLLYGKKGACVGWLSFTNNELTATLDWFRPVAIKGIYTGGFSTNATLLGSKYIPPSTGECMIDLTNTVGNALLALGGGNLVSALSNSVTVATNNTVTIMSGSINNLTVKLVPKKGTFSGSFLHPVTQKAVKFQGAMLQLQDFGAGYFIGSNETGYVEFHPVE